MSSFRIKSPLYWGTFWKRNQVNYHFRMTQKPFFLVLVLTFSMSMQLQCQCLINGGIVVRILHHVTLSIYLYYNDIFWEKAAWVHQAHDTEQLNLFNMMIGLTHHEKHTSCTCCTWCKILTTVPPKCFHFCRGVKILFFKKKKNVPANRKELSFLFALPDSIF